MDKVIIQQLGVQARVGVYGWEHQIQQRLIVDIECGLDLVSAGQSDRLEDTLDYAALSQALQELAAKQHYQLIETLATCMAEHVLTTPFVQWVRVRVGKPGAVRGASCVAVEIERIRA